MRDLAEEYVTSGIAPLAASWGEVMKVDKNKGEKVFDPDLLPKISLKHIETKVQKVFDTYT